MGKSPTARLLTPTPCFTYSHDRATVKKAGVLLGFPGCKYLVSCRMRVAWTSQRHMQPIENACRCLAT